MRKSRIWRRIVVTGAVATIGMLPAGRTMAQTSPTTPTTHRPASPAPGTKPPAQVIQSWALTPLGDPQSAGGDRPNLSYEVAAGTQIKDAVTLFNLSNVQLTFQLYSTDALNTDSGGFDLLPRAAKATDVGTWVTVAQGNITLPARKQATIPITINVPVTATPGDHVGGIVASNTSIGVGPDGKAVLLDRRTGPRVYLRVAGPLNPRLTVEHLNITYHAALNPFAGSADVSFRVANRGNIRLQGSEKVSVSGPFGLFTRSQATITLPEILPGQSIGMHATFSGVVATFVGFGRVRLFPQPVGGVTAKISSSWRALTLALPFTILVLVLSAWLLLRARRAYLRRNRPAPPDAPVAREPQLVR